MNHTIEQQTIYHVDAEHGSLRFAVLLIFLVVWVIGFATLSALIESDGLNLIAALLSFLAAFGVTTLIERQLKTRWPSGRTVNVDGSGVRVMRKGKVEQEMPADLAVNQIFWRFTVSRRTRIPKGWSMLACALESEDKHLTVYTFMSPTQFESYHYASSFTQLASRKETEGRTDLRLAGEQRRLREAEAHRWHNGAEMNADDFVSYVEQVKTQFPEWMPIQ